MKQFLSLFVLVFFSSVVQAEPDACRDVPYDFSKHDASELRLLSAQCSSKAFQDLNLHRAYYKDLMADFNSMQSLDFDSPFMRLNPHRHARAYRMFIHLVEAFSANAAASANDRARLLNEVYDRANEIAELRLKGYKSRADWLELHSGLRSNGS